MKISNTKIFFVAMLSITPMVRAGNLSAGEIFSVHPFRDINMTARHLVTCTSEDYKFELRIPRIPKKCDEQGEKCDTVPASLLATKSGKTIIDTKNAFAFNDNAGYVDYLVVQDYLSEPGYVFGIYRGADNVLNYHFIMLKNGSLTDLVCKWSAEF